ncbi:MAG: hypothetical protein OZSIB_1430 [Candidatus Ozemobacter sibiricus]|jgi:energy-coupling factor transport system permease protein|uniref:Energy-coupling factor transporter transmembrane protein EcfT n=1 Tax=Candidatus Ozemobacter sibiricus TaxID=2268124 RepID=A0A367ZKE7_9BACT|nr:MAG: hypothetical protein OZSIB_1430 [Candidatus Ozemobacter sibiricus]
MRSLTYRPADTFLYRLHPVTKGVGTFLWILWFSLHPWGLPASLAGLLGLLLVARLGGVPVLEILRELRGLILLLIVVALINLGGEGPAVGWRAGDAVVRVCGIFLWSAVLVTISSPAELTHFWELAFRPLGLFGVAAHELALVMVIGLRFLPVVLEEMERIRMAQAARGAGLPAGAGLVARVHHLLPLLIPTLVLSIHRASDLALAMEARGYRLSGQRSRYHEFRPQAGDLAAAFLLLALIIGTLWGRWPAASLGRGL